MNDRMGQLSIQGVCRDGVPAELQRVGVALTNPTHILAFAPAKAGAGAVFASWWKVQIELIIPSDFYQTLASVPWDEPAGCLLHGDIWRVWLFK